MSLPAEINEYLKFIVDVAKELMPVKTIYLFGSYADGTYGEYSDVDIYLVTSDKSKPRRELALLMRKAVRGKSTLPLDILVNDADNFSKNSKNKYSVEYEAKTKGRVLYASN